MNGMFQLMDNLMLNNELHFLRILKPNQNEN